VRLGDKSHDGIYTRVYAATSFEYYRQGMREVSRKLRSGGAAGVAFIVTAGGTMEGNAADVAEARQHLQAQNVFFSTASSPYVDLAVLRKCDGLVVGPSSFGWWAAYLAKLPPCHVVAPRMLYNPLLPRTNKLVKGFHTSDYYPADWVLLGNDGNGSHAAATECMRRASSSSSETSSNKAKPSTLPSTMRLPVPRRGPSSNVCFVRFVGACKGYTRPQYRSWFPASKGAVGRDACVQRRLGWQKVCARTAEVQMRWGHEECSGDTRSAQRCLLSGVQLALPGLPATFQQATSLSRARGLLHGGRSTRSAG
jgi:hypothetical protein